MKGPGSLRASMLEFPASQEQGICLILADLSRLVLLAGRLTRHISAFSLLISLHAANLSERAVRGSLLPPPISRVSGPDT